MRIQPHVDHVPRGYKLIDSLQAGPQLLPNFTARPEAFIRYPASGKEVDSIGSSMRAGRTAFGIKDDGTAVIVCVRGRRTTEFAEGISLPQLADFMRRLDCTSAINFDGGTSTTMVVILPREEVTQDSTLEAQAADLDKTCLKTIVSSSPERKVKTILYVAPR